ncbi:MAG TPA: xanthine dehydrogenase family protein molybdopterin-binding subunit [Actinomycetota bacterium]
MIALPGPGEGLQRGSMGPNGSFVGRALPGVNNTVLARGRGRFVDDIHLPGMCHMTVLRSPYPHARIKSIDIDEARQLRGVVHVVTREEIRRDTRPIPEGWDTTEAGAKKVDWYALAVDRVRYVGEAVAAVVAEDKYTAISALDFIKVDYETLPAVVDASTALEEGSPLVEPEWGDNVLVTDGFRAGDVDRALTEAEGVIRGSVRSQRITGVPIEPRGIVAVCDPTDDLLTFWESTQQPHAVRTFLAQVLRMPETRIRVIQPHVGGAFGLKQPTSQEEVLVAYLARRLRRPVKWIEERAESLQVGGHSRETVCQYEAAFDRAGKVTGLRVRIIADVGAPTAYLGWGMSFVTMLCIPTVYKIPNIDVGLTSVVTNKCPWTPYRGFGKDVATFLMDRIMDRVADETDLSRAEVRFRNFLQPDEFPYQQGSGAMLDSGNYPAALRRLLGLIDADQVEGWRAQARARGTRVGVGLGYELTPEGVAMPGSIMNNGYDGATVRVSPTGRVTVLAGVTSPGTGNETALAQIAADALGCRLDAVEVLQGDTDLCPWGLGNYSSRSIIIGGSAVREAALDIREKVDQVAGKMLGADPAQVEAGEGVFHVVGDSARHLTFEEIVRQIYWHAYEEFAEDIEPALEATRYFRIPNIRHGADGSERDNVYPTWPNGAVAVAVEVDPETGLIKVLRYWTVEDAGTIVNPLLAEATLHGGIAQGIGSALFEQVVYDEWGQPLTGTLMDYTIPTAVELPRFTVRHQETPSPFTPLGTKGVGESGLGGVLGALCSAVEDAFPELQLHFDELPLTPGRVWRALHDAVRTRRSRGPS